MASLPAPPGRLSPRFGARLRLPNPSHVKHVHSRPEAEVMSPLYKNVLYNLMGQGIVLVLGFVGVKFIFSRLGADAFGIIFFTQVLTGVLTTALELGVLSTTVREVSAHFESELEYVRQLISTASMFYWGLGALLCPAVFVSAPFLVEHWINLKTIDAGTATTMLRVLAITTLIMLPRALYSSIFQGRQRMELNTAIYVAASSPRHIHPLTLPPNSPH